ncbi:centriole, cilia and spindle-associated protein-like [Rhinolophus ferrumequinum]|uniref:Centriole, cilia and spindle associated protein n=1 Tax=Rhinolophus ferrumequinum TaxID=59479 RepID=A0A671FLJ9_RHIFE|nr:centriole, cilia and spindle-associated protein-like [Rhinolophus ferrumequinum]
MSPGSGMKSEYMKRYREPRWDEYAPCYRELLLYRRGRRLLEQAHAAWLWDDRGAAGAPVGPARRARGAPEEPAGDAEAGNAGATALPAMPVKDIKEPPEQQVRTNETDLLPSCAPRWQQGALFARGAGKAVRNPPRPSSQTKEKHPFALYGGGEKHTDTGSQRTHNVRASAPACAIHESALRAKTRRQTEKRTVAAQRQRTHSVEVRKGRRTKPSSSESPWVSEYRRRYSARA